MEHISFKINRLASDMRKTERGEMMKLFCSKINAGRIRENLLPITMSRMGKILEGIPTKDLYYLKRVCSDSPNFSKRFWWELDPKKHQETREATKLKGLH